jgi:ferric-dicitrate binding protein FerR (iron transport regulator)
MNKIYENYTATDFLKDESFLKNLLFPAQKDTDFWNDFLKEHPEKQTEINRAREIFHTITFNKETFTSKEKYEILEAINQKIRRHKRRRILKIRRTAAVAAGLAVLVGLSSVFFLKKDVPDGIAYHQTQTEYNGNDIQLILSDDQSVRLDPNTRITYSGEGKIVVSSNDDNTQAVFNAGKNRWNKLIVPKGKRSFLKLADGSGIWVNSGTTLEFPVAFAGNERRIKVDGEVYIEVVKDRDKPFYLNTVDMEISVLGTRFNVSAYSGDTEQSVVLVEGSVAVKAEKHSGKKILLPEQMLSKTASGISTKKTNVYNHISWKDGLLQFESENLSVILEKLSRYYNVPVECREDIRKMKCSGKLVLFDDFEEVLQTISSTLPVKIEKNGNQIHVKK